MRILYHLSDYVSFRASGLAYIECLKYLGHEVYTDPGIPTGVEDCDLAVLHSDPLDFVRAYAAFPALRQKPVVGYAVWEGNRLPDAFMEGLALVDAVWTCSRYSQQSMLEAFPDAAVVPHVVERHRISPADLKEARALLGSFSSDDFLFFSIIDAINPRKNIKDLLFAFSRLRGETRRPVRLVLKQYRASMDFSGIPGVYSVEGELAPGVLRALHSLCHAYVSAHHAEGWGLGLSEAMAYGKPAIATGYSGNMEFMDERNSFPVPYTLGPVSEEMCRRLPWFRPDMIWANVDKGALIQAMKDVAEGRYDLDIPRRAMEITRSFGIAEVARIMEPLVEQVVETAGKGKKHV